MLENIVTTPTQSQLNSKIGCDTKMTLDHSPPPDQEKILALLASWSFHRKPTAKRGNISIEKVLYITKKQALKAVLVC